MKDFIENKGNKDIYGSKDATRKAFALGLIEDGEIWMQMIKSRNLTSYTYDEGTADEIIAIIKGLYFEQFQKFKIDMEEFEIKGSKNV